MSNTHKSGHVTVEREREGSQKAFHCVLTRRNRMDSKEIPSGFRVRLPQLLALSLSLARPMPGVLWKMLSRIIH